VSLAAEAEARQRRLDLTRRLFNETAPVYDRFNQVFSLGWGGWYRRRCLKRAGLVPGMRVLDVAVGTGLVAREAMAIAGPEGAVIGLDLSEAMLREARRKLPIGLIQGAADQLPIADASVDFLTMGYALRHVPELGQLLREFHRILRPGGVLLLIEMRPPRHAITRRIAPLLFERIVPTLCRWTMGTAGPLRLMEHHWQTIDQGLVPSEVVGAIEAGGFAAARCEIYFDLFCSYAGRKPGA
jgi:demethylmenaquinone methyltransferase/2-methoxy-6-polyprenyl-1,4-benzoquinol methylase